MSTLHLDKKTDNYIVITLFILVILVVIDVFLGLRIGDITKTLDERGAMGVAYFKSISDMQKEVSDIKISIKNIDDNIKILAKEKNENHK